MYDIYYMKMSSRKLARFFILLLVIIGILAIVIVPILSTFVGY